MQNANNPSAPETAIKRPQGDVKQGLDDYCRTCDSMSQYSIRRETPEGYTLDLCVKCPHYQESKAAGAQTAK